ncbi:COPI associated protein-domain-containing protein [Helicostylum pulchrum]|nr:COPI associated protein-domain-containing protein [Helicostylum pulchrum]
METSTSKVVVYKSLSLVVIFGLLLSLIGDFVSSLYWTVIVNAIFKIFLIVALTLIEFRQSPGIVKPFSFMFYFFGRGTFYVILGFITLGRHVVSWVGGILIAVIGVVFIVFHCINNGKEPEYMSFFRYQRLTSGMSHDLPTATSNQYPVAHQVPLSEHNVAQNSGLFPAGQYSNSEPVSPQPVHILNGQEKTEI